MRPISASSGSGWVADPTENTPLARGSGRTDAASSIRSVRIDATSIAESPVTTAVRANTAAAPDAASSTPATTGATRMAPFWIVEVATLAAVTSSADRASAGNSAKWAGRVIPSATVAAVASRTTTPNGTADHSATAVAAIVADCAT